MSKHERNCSDMPGLPDSEKRFGLARARRHLALWSRPSSGELLRQGCKENEDGTGDFLFLKKTFSLSFSPVSGPAGADRNIHVTADNEA